MVWPLHPYYFIKKLVIVKKGQKKLCLYSETKEYLMVLNPFACFNV